MNVPDLSLSVTHALLRTHGAKQGGEKTPPRHLVIAISREAGALGSTIAREIGRRLECPVYDRNIVEKVAEELGTPVSELRRFDEMPTFWVEDWLSGMIRQNTVSADTFFRHLVAAIRGLAEVGRCVIVGRGSPRVLPLEQTLRVRLIGDRPDRIATIREQRQCTEREAAEWVDRIEKERNEFLQRRLNFDPTDPHQFDLVVNTSRLSIHESAEVIIQAFLRMETRGRAPDLSLSK
jgi:cytidylate kinase